MELGRQLLETGAVRRAGALAIVGAGIAGLTLAAMLALAAPNLRIVLFEKHRDVMFLQAASEDRFVHPHIFDWPVDEAAQDQAGLPFMDWIAGTADSVAASLLEQFDAAKRHGRIEVRTRCVVDGLRSVGLHDLQLSVNGQFLDDEFDAVVLCIGFGLEHGTTLRNPSYWKRSLLAEPYLLPEGDPQVFISGNGDGGLADFALAAFNAMRHQDIMLRIVRHEDTKMLVPLLLRLDDEAWKDTAFDIFSAYKNELAGMLSTNLVRDVRGMLRPHGRVVLHTSTPNLLRKETALVNRLIAFLALHADERYALGKLTTITGLAFDPIQSVGDALVLVDGQQFTPDWRVLRFGPDKDSIQLPFKAQFDSYRAARDAAKPLQRPKDPTLTDATRSWAEGVVAAAGLKSSDGDVKRQLGAPSTDQLTVEKSRSQVNVIMGNIGNGATVTQIYSPRKFED